MAVRSRRIWGPQELPIAPTLVFTCPVGRTAIVKSTWFMNTDVVAQSFDLWIKPVGGVDPIQICRVTGAAKTRIREESFIVLNPGDELYANRTTGAAGVGVGFGSLLLGEPE